MSTRRDPKNYPNAFQGSLTEPLSVSTAGQKYRVRDDRKDASAESPNKVWGRHLSYADAHKLKERVVGARKSRTAIIENEAIAVHAVQPQLVPVVVAAPVIVEAPPPPPAPVIAETTNGASDGLEIDDATAAALAEFDTSDSELLES
jgi:hypothetical protein